MYQKAGRHLQQHGATPTSDLVGAARPLTEKQKTSLQQEIADSEQALREHRQKLSVIKHCRAFGKKAVGRLAGMDRIRDAWNSIDRKVSLRKLADDIASEAASEMAEFLRHFGIHPDIAILQGQTRPIARSLVFQRASKLEPESRLRSD